ncbi:MAG: TIGR03087 family PEP-CTERM/XrtA system glycosyltransferase [Pseudomonadales bacterium]|jgi:sugar transferase (PEP-CTERM/EpsH1 system associated)|nr:TIGR03087 family PEP-CTERM/XrtA system glycosyltransferase [Pseudomonadales bacterium]MCP5321413.1 TIGR03087 family PEP-CTERM/XrtA system glycosyltransferase [Pseudomonadales bacterium]MCP5336323.1 TIGR03087 family PEP-CTERM/XrtA system glycosyltransferase [Pseudomonadales bacterium]
MSIKPPLLFLCHRIPFPPNKGDKIRSWNLLRYLCEHYRVYLGAFIDDPADWAHTGAIEGICAGCRFIGLTPHLAKLNSLSAFVTGRALSLPYYRSRRLRRWVEATVAEQQIRRVLVYSSAMAQYATDQRLGFQRRVIDFVDVDSDKWRQYAQDKRWPMSWVYRREADYLFRYERHLAESFDACLFVSSAEAELFRQLAPELARNIGHYNNGVDTDYFRPDPTLANPYPQGTTALVFTGAMDYWPNVDAVKWFAGQVLPRVREARPEVRFYVVGGKPAEAVRALAGETVVVTGRVDDVRPYVQYASAAVAPMRIARGIQNKVLEAMAMARPVVVSPQGLEGIDASPGAEVLLADGADEFVQHTLAACSGMHPDIGRAARERVRADFVWEHNLPLVHGLLQTDTVTLREYA